MKRDTPDLTIHMVTGLICIEVQSEIPVGAGLGSSAAYGAAIAAALTKALFFLLEVEEAAQ